MKQLEVFLTVQQDIIVLQETIPFNVLLDITVPKEQ
jgi:hypothetical protein